MSDNPATTVHAAVVTMLIQPASWSRRPYCALVSSVIDVAWIGVAGVAIGGFISITGTAVNGRIAHRAAETTIEGQRRQRLWEKQSAAYEETVREVLARQTRREVLTSRGDVGNIGSHPIEEMRKHEEPESIRITARLLAYASAAVWACTAPKPVVWCLT